MGITREISPELEPIEFPDSMDAQTVDAYIAQNGPALRSKLIARRQSQLAAETEGDEALKAAMGQVPFMERVGSTLLAAPQSAMQQTGQTFRGLGEYLAANPIPVERGEIAPDIRRENIRRAQRTPAQVEQEVEASPVRRFGGRMVEAAPEVFPTLPGVRDELPSQVSSGVGSVAALLPAGLAGPAAPVLAGGMYGLSAGEESADDAARVIDDRIAAALAQGDTATAADLERRKFDLKNKARAAGRVIGASTEGVLGLAGKIRVGKSQIGGIGARLAERMVPKSAPEFIQNRVRGGVEGAVTEATQELTEQGLGNAAAMAVYDPSRGITDNLVESFVVGGLTGKLVGGVAGSRGEPRDPLPASRAAAREVAPVIPEDVGTPDLTIEDVGDILPAPKVVETPTVADVTVEETPAVAEAPVASETVAESVGMVGPKLPPNPKSSRARREALEAALNQPQEPETEPAKRQATLLDLGLADADAGMDWIRRTEFATTPIDEQMLSGALKRNLKLPDEVTRLYVSAGAIARKYLSGANVNPDALTQLDEISGSMLPQLARRIDAAIKDNVEDRQVEPLIQLHSALAEYGTERQNENVFNSIEESDRYQKWLEKGSKRKLTKTEKRVRNQIKSERTADVVSRFTEGAESVPTPFDTTAETSPVDQAILARGVQTELADEDAQASVGEAVEAIPELPTELAKAIAAEEAPDVFVENTVRKFGESERASAESTKPTERQRQVLEKGKRIAAEKGWDWNQVKQTARKQLGLNEDFLKPDSRADQVLQMMRKEDADAAKRGQRTAEEMARIDTETKARKEKEAADKAQSESEQRKQAEEKAAESQRNADQFHDDIVAKLPDSWMQSWSKAKTKKVRQNLLNRVMVASDSRNAEALTAAVERRVAAEPLAEEAPGGAKTAAESQYESAKTKLDALGPEPRKPSNERRRFGTQGRAKASPESVAQYDAEVKAYKNWRARYSKLKKAEVEASNAVLREDPGYFDRQRNAATPAEPVIAEAPAAEPAPKQAKEVATRQPKSNALAAQEIRTETPYVRGDYNSYVESALSPLVLPEDPTKQQQFFVGFANFIRSRLRRKYGGNLKESLERTNKDPETGRDRSFVQDEANKIAREAGGVIGGRVKIKLNEFLDSVEPGLRKVGATNEDIAKFREKIDSTAGMVANLVAGASPRIGPEVLGFDLGITEKLWVAAHGLVRDAVQAIKPSLGDPETIDGLVFEIMGGNAFTPAPSAQTPSATTEPSAPSTAPAAPQSDILERALDAAIKATDRSSATFSDPFLIAAVGLPVLNAALRIVRRVYLKTRDLARAKRQGMRLIRRRLRDDAKADLPRIEEAFNQLVDGTAEQPAPDEIQRFQAADGTTRQKSRGRFTGDVTVDTDAQWQAGAEQWINQFNGNIRRAFEAAKSTDYATTGLNPAAQTYVFGRLLELSEIAVNAARNDVDMMRNLNLQKEITDAIRQQNAESGKALGAANLVQNRTLWLNPVLSYRNLIREAQKRLPFPEVTADEVRAWLQESGRRAVQEMRNAMTDADKVFAREFKATARDMRTVWRDVMTASVESQEASRRKILEELVKAPELAGMSREGYIDIANLLGRAWEQERARIFASEFRKQVPMPTVKEDARRKLFTAIPDILKWANLGLLDNEAFRNAVAPKFGVAKFDGETAKKLNEMAQKAQKVGGVNRKEIIKEMYRIMQTDGGVRSLDLVRDYWYAAVLTALDTQVDNVMGIINGQMLTAMGIAMAKPEVRRIMGKAYKDGFYEGVKDFWPILANGEFARSINFNTEQTGNTLEAIGASRNRFARALQIGKYTGRFMEAINHINALSVNQPMLAWALSNRFPMEHVLRYMMPSEKVRQDAIAKAQAEGTRPDLMMKRVREIIQESIPVEVLLSAKEISDIAGFTNKPHGLLGVVYQMLNDAEKKLSGVKLLTGTNFARFAFNAFNQSLNLVAPVALYRYWASQPGRQDSPVGLKFGQEHRKLILAQAAFGTALATFAAALFLGDDDEEKDRFIDINGSFKSLPDNKRKQLLNEGRLPYSIRVGNKYISYRQLPFGAVLAAIGELRDRQLFAKDEWNQESILRKFGDGMAAGVLTIKDAPAISSFTEFLGVANAYKFDPNEQLEKSWPRYLARLSGSFIPRAFKQVDAWADPSIYKANTGHEFFLQQLPYGRRTLGEGPVLNVLGEPVQVERYPWSRWLRTRKEDKAWATLGELASNGVFMPVPVATVQVLDNGKRREMTPAESYKYQKRVGKAYRKFIEDNAAQLLRMKPDEANEFIKNRTEQIRERIRSGA